MPFTVEIDQDRARRRVAGSDVVVHCHHYNSRLQRVIEGAAAVDGKAIWLESSERSWTGVLERALEGVTDAGERWRRALELYRFLGFGRLEVPPGELPGTTVIATASHFVEGWSAREPDRREPVCSFTAGFLQAAAWVALGREVSVHEVRCQQSRAASCEFVSRSRAAGAPRALHRVAPSARAVATPVATRAEQGVRSRVDERRIIDEVWAMPMSGGERGLVPAFNVFLASMPSEFYSLVTFEFLEAMRAAGVGALGRRMLVQVAEICGLNTFSGIRSSAEWDALVAPMCRDEADELIGLVAVSNALGWGTWLVTELEPAERAELVCRDGYEAEGQLDLAGPSHEPVCLMLQGVSAGLMALVYGSGSVRDRVGQFAAQELRCRAAGAPSCEFRAEEAA